LYICFVAKTTSPEKENLEIKLPGLPGWEFRQWTFHYVKIHQC